MLLPPGKELLSALLLLLPLLGITSVPGQLFLLATSGRGSCPVHTDSGVKLGCCETSESPSQCGTRPLTSVLTEEPWHCN